MSISTPGVGTNSTGQAEQGTTGSSISNDSSTTLSTNQFLDLMMDELQNQDPLNPSSSDPTQYLTELAQMTSVEQETNTAQNTQDSAQAQSVSQAVGLIGDTVTYINQTTGASTSGTVNSVQITNTGPTLTVDGVAGVIAEHDHQRDRRVCWLRLRLGFKLGLGLRTRRPKAGRERPDQQPCAAAARRGGRSTGARDNGRRTRPRLRPRHPRTAPRSRTYWPIRRPARTHQPSRSTRWTVWPGAGSR